MKTRMIYHSLAICCLLPAFAFTTGENDPFIKSPTVAKLTNTPNGPLISCDLKALKDTVNFPLSQLTEELQIVKLDNRDEALIGGWIRTTVGEKYILVSNNKQTPYKLFDRTGKFITNIGSYGQGPNEYLNTYAEQLDEANNRIYILPWQSSKILVFDLKGNALDPIPLCLRVPKGKFRVNTAKSEVTVTVLPFPKWPAVVWTQDLKGKRKNFVAPGSLAMPQDFSNEVSMGNNTAAYDVMLMKIMPQPSVDTLYHYNAASNKLEGRFTVKYPSNDKIPWHAYYEIPKYFIGDVSFPIQIDESTFSGSKPAYYMVDKKTLHGNYVRLYNDFISTPSQTIYPSFNNGYYVTNMEPMALKEILEKEVNKKGLTADKKKKVQNLIKTLNDNDNNVRQTETITRWFIEKSPYRRIFIFRYRRPVIFLIERYRPLIVSLITLYFRKNCSARPGENSSHKEATVQPGANISL